MSTETPRFDTESTNGIPDTGRGGFVALAVIAAAIGAGAALLLAPDQGSRLHKRVRQRLSRARREKQIVGLAGFFIGAGLAAILNPESGPVTRERLTSTLGRIRVGAVDRIERLRRRAESKEQSAAESQPVRSVQELGRDPNTVF
jgi:gas vesicle protein